MGIGEWFGSVWNGIKNTGRWVWDNVARPVISGVGAFMNSPYAAPLIKTATDAFPEYGGAIQMGQQIGQRVSQANDVLNKFGL